MNSDTLSGRTIKGQTIVYNVYPTELSLYKRMSTSPVFIFKTDLTKVDLQDSLVDKVWQED